MAHKSGKQFFGMDVRGSRTSFQDDTEDGCILDGHVILNSGKDFYQLSFVRAKTSLARVQRAL